ncbi:MAG: hypothetical protein JST54_17130 [Deltaproteobacteria bacterium]|nr:hypothetical protein [Deltaproteobacteria bacterium]
MAGTRGLQRALLLLVLGVAAPARAQLDASSHPAGVARNDVPLWENPDVLRDPKKRESFEFVEMFDHRREKPSWNLRVFAEHPEYKQHPEKLPPTILLGDLLFHAPAVLGKPASFFGMSCASCHPNGAASVDIDVGTEAELPGNVDMTSHYFTPLADDGFTNPRNVPSLRGAKYTGPYGHAGSVSSVGEFVDHVISQELANPPLRRDWHTALTVYVEQLEFLPNPRLDVFGRLTDQADAAAHRGEKLFNAPRAQLDGMACASCHVPESFFTDRRSHAFHHGQGNAAPTEGFDTPTLLNLAESPPYFYNGSAKTLADAVNTIDARSKLGLTADEKKDLTAYLAAVGAVDEPATEPSVSEQVVHPVAYLSLLTDGPVRDDQDLWTVCLETVRHELHGVLRGLSGDARAALEGPIHAFEKHVADAKNRTPSSENRKALVELRKKLLDAAAGQQKLAKHAAK